MKPRIERNIVANVATRLWAFASAYLFVPFYLRFLGIEAFGLVGFYSTLTAAVAFADMGLTATLNRELARLSTRAGATAEMRDLLRTYETLYLAISTLLALGFWTLSPWLGVRWLNTVTLRPEETTTAIRLLGLSIALQLPTALYLGGLMGLERQVGAAYLQVAVGALRGVGGVLVLWCVSPTIVAFAWWQLGASALGLLATRSSLWRVLSSGDRLPRPRFSRRALDESWHYASGMASLAVLTALLTQADRLALSKMVPLEKFSYYSLAGALGSIPLLIGGAIAAAVFPRLTALVTAADRAGTTRLYRQFTTTMSVVAFPVALTLAVFSDVVLYAWTGSRAVAENGAAVARLLIAGQLMQVLMSGPFYLELAHGGTRLTVFFSLFSVTLIVPLLVGLIPVYGVLGAGIAWVVMNALTLPPYVYFVHKRRLPRDLGSWIWRALVVPMIAATPLVMIARRLIPETASRVAGVGQLGVVWLLSFGTCLLAAPELAIEALRRARGMLR